MITSARPQEGKTTTSINTAVVLAQKGVRVLLIDADLRRPSIHKTLGMGRAAGSATCSPAARLSRPSLRSKSSRICLFCRLARRRPIRPSCSPPRRCETCSDDLREQYDHIVIDTPPTLSVTDAVVFRQRVDSVVLVIRSGKTTKQALRRSRDILMQVNARVTGVLLNAVDLSSP